jgi:hypothetical protein
LLFATYGRLYNLVDANKNVAESVASAMESNFDKIPEDVKNRLYGMTGTNERVSAALATMIHLHFKELEPALLSKILLSMSNVKFEDTITGVALFIMNNYNKIDPKALDELMKNPEIINFLKRNSSMLDDILRKKINL